MLLGLRLAAEADGLAADAARDDVLEPGEGAAADEEDVGRVHLDVLLLGMLAAALRRHVGDGAFEHLEEGLLHAFAGDVAGDRDVVRGLADLVDFVDVDDAALGRFEVEVGGVQQLEQDVLDVFADVAGFGQRGGVADGEGNVQHARQRSRQQGLAAAGRPDQEDVGLVELDVGFRVLAVDQPLVVIMHGDREDLLGSLLADHVGIELFLELARGRDIGEERLGHAAPLALLVEDLLAQARCNRRRCRRRRDLRRAGRRRDSSCGRTSNRRSSWDRPVLPELMFAPPLRFPPPPDEPPPVISLPDGMRDPFVPLRDCFDGPAPGEAVTSSWHVSAGCNEPEHADAATIIAHEGTNGKHSPTRETRPGADQPRRPRFPDSSEGPEWLGGMPPSDLLPFHALSLTRSQTYLRGAPGSPQVRSRGTVCVCRMAIESYQRSCGSRSDGKRHMFNVAEEVGFKPTVGLHLHRFSRPALSTTQAPLRLRGDGNTAIGARRRGVPAATSSHFTKWPAFLEEFFEHFAALSRHHARGDLAPVVEPRVRNHADKGWRSRRPWDRRAP